LAPLTSKIQWDVKRKRPEPLTRAERKAFAKLVACKYPGRIRVTGPLVRSASALTLEVRKFQQISKSGG
jgi:hypothetical protein